MGRPRDPRRRRRGAGPRGGGRARGLGADRHLRAGRARQHPHPDRPPARPQPAAGDRRVAHRRDQRAAGERRPRGARDRSPLRRAAARVPLAHARLRAHHGPPLPGARARGSQRGRRAARPAPRPPVRPGRRRRGGRDRAPRCPRVHGRAARRRAGPGAAAHRARRALRGLRQRQPDARRRGARGPAGARARADADPAGRRRAGADDPRAPELRRRGNALQPPHPAHRGRDRRAVVALQPGLRDAVRRQAPDARAGALLRRSGRRHAADRAQRAGRLDSRDARRPRRDLRHRPHRRRPHPVQVRARLGRALAALLACAALLGSSTAADASSAERVGPAADRTGPATGRTGPAAEAHRTGPEAIEALAQRRLDPRLLELTLRTPAVAQPTGVRVLLPTGYRAHPKRRYPVLYLLHGAFDDFRSWTEDGDAEALTAGLPLIVVMPDSGAGMGYVDWYNGGRFGPPAWETYHVKQLIPWIDERFRTIDARPGRAVAGLSMGGGGALHYAARHPDLFVHAAGFSPAVDVTHPALIALNQLGAPQPDGSTAPGYGPYATQEVRWRGHNPLDLAENLRGLGLSLRTGDGRAGGEYGGGDVIEATVYEMASALHERLDRLRIEHRWDDYGPGGHTWPYWRRDLRLELPRIMEAFRDLPRRPRAFTFTSIDPSYEDYAWRVRLDRPELEFSRLSVTGRRRFALSGSGSALVRTPRRFEPGHAYRLRIAGDAGRSRRTIRANRRGSLRIAIELGPPNEFQQYTPEAEAAGTRAYETSVRIAPR
ncbi:MAG: hypothetical protein GEU88_12755 [Solirubrobacterales bacterium]|nr:hypothetical protein [Solirubrobacterales bacterium]